jgi:hypothetical protein
MQTITGKQVISLECAPRLCFDNNTVLTVVHSYYVVFVELDPTTLGCLFQRAMKSEPPHTPTGCARKSVFHMRSGVLVAHPQQWPTRWVNAPPFQGCKRPRHEPFTTGFIYGASPWINDGRGEALTNGFDCCGQAHRAGPYHQH